MSSSPHFSSSLEFQPQKKFKWLLNHLFIRLTLFEILDVQNKFWLLELWEDNI